MKIKNIFALGTISLFSLASFLSCSPSSSVKQDGKKIQIFYNNDNFAYLEPCGCRVSPIGGMDRRWNAMKSYPDESRVFVDSGNLLFKSTKATEYLSPQWYEQAAGVIEAYNLLGADAVALGSTDFALGVAKFQELAKTAKFPFLSSNIFWKGTDNLFVKSHLMVERHGKKIGIFSVFHPSLPLPSELEARDPVSHAKEMVKKLRSDGANMIVALSHQGYDEDLKFLKSVSGIDLLVGAHSQSLLQSPDMEGNTLVVQLSNQGQMLGMVEYEAESLPKKRTQFVVAELNNEFDDGPAGLANPMKNLLAITNLRIAEANRKLDERVWAAHKGKELGFQTFLSCRDCHGKQANFQEGKRHASAFLTLMAKGKETNLDCVKCHSVGMGVPGGFRAVSEAFLDENGQPVPLEKIKAAMGAHAPHANTDYRKNPAQIRPDVAKWIDAMKREGVKKSFVSVQCENCHGPRPGHPFDSNEPATKVVRSTCISCHTQEQMPAWYDGKKQLKAQVVDQAIKAVACPR